MGWITDALRRWRFNRGRLLFAFFDGERTRRIDPWRTYRGLVNDPQFDFEADGEAAANDEEPAYTNYIETVCRHFGLKRFDGERGLADEEIDKILTQFMLYTVELKKKSDPSLTWESSTVGSSPAELGTGAITNSPSDSGSPSTGPALDELGVSSTPSDSPSVTSKTPASNSTNPTGTKSPATSPTTGQPLDLSPLAPVCSD